MVLRVDVVADAVDGDPGFVGDRLVDKHGAELRFVDRDDIEAQAPTRADLVLLLGSARSAHALAEAVVVESESTFARAALASGVPVLGICYGAQLLAHALGGTVTAAAQAEIGWFSIDSVDPSLCPPGPWTQFHSDAFTAPPTARILGASAAGCQGFTEETRAAPALGWQFHPEVTPKRFVTWIDRLRTYCTLHGADPDALIAAAYDQEERLRAAAYDLTDSAVDFLLS
jgi:GMP synthase (glutamine-hydrolysing)